MLQIDINQNVTSRLQFEPIEAHNGFCLGFLNNVSIETSPVNEDAKWEFKGYETPRLVFEFIQKKDQYNTKERFHIHSELPISRLKSNGESREEATIVKDYLALWGRVKHIHDMFSTSANFKAITEAPKFTPEADIATRLAEFKKFFEDMVNLFNMGTDGNPIYKPFTVEGTEKCLTLKLIVNTLNDKSYLGFPKYVGQGFAERTTINNGKIDTALKFQPKETYRITSAVIPPVPNQMSNKASNLPADVLSIIQQQ